VADPSVNYVVTVPGPQGPLVAFGAEFAISFLLIAIILNVSNSRRLTRYTPWVAGLLIASYISIESPFSGMSMNPARTIGSALPAGYGQPSGCISSLPCSPCFRQANSSDTFAAHIGYFAPNITTTTTSVASSVQLRSNPQ
jgi:hypothetical protein